MAITFEQLKRDYFEALEALLEFYSPEEIESVWEEINDIDTLVKFFKIDFCKWESGDDSECQEVASCINGFTERNFGLSFHSDKKTVKGIMNDFRDFLKELVAE